MATPNPPDMTDTSRPIGDTKSENVIEDRLVVKETEKQLNNLKLDPFQSKGQCARTLSPEELAKLEKDTNLVSDFKQQKLEKEAQRNWDIFYKRNSTKFFKDRHWTTREFKEICGSSVSMIY